MNQEAWKPDFAPTVEGLSALRRRGPYSCRECGSEMLEMPGVCDACADVAREQARRERLLSARKSIPLDYRHLSFGSAELAARCTVPRRLYNAKCIMQRMLSRQVHLVLIDGPTGTAKTSMAAAMLLLAIESSPLGPGSRFVFAPDVARAYSDAPKGTPPEILHTCHDATLLVIDNLGQDNVYRDNLRTVIQTRDAARRPTIVTTFLTEHEVGYTYGGGLMRRLFQECERLSTDKTGAEPAELADAERQGDCPRAQGPAGQPARPMGTYGPATGTGP